jgi:hypothetical protein
VSETVFGSGGPEPPPTVSMYQAEYDWRDEIGRRVDGLNIAIWAAITVQASLTSIALTGGTHRAVKTILIQVVNDFNDLLDDISTGSGRPAMRTARSLVEHAVNLRTVGESLANAQRYLDHLEQGRVLAMDLEIGADLLTGTRRKAYLHALRAAGRGAKRKFEEALKLYGRSFASRWIDADLATRARKHGLEEHYKFYRLASLVMHGSAGGVLGSVRTHRDGEVTYRTGQALQLAPVAMLGGLKAYLECLKGLAVVRPDIDIKPYTRPALTLVELWPSYLAAITELDNEVWPDERVNPPAAILAISRTGVRRWWLQLPWANVLIRGLTPDLPEWIERNIDELVQVILSDTDKHFRPEDRWVTIRVENVTVNPDESGRWIPDTAIMLRPEEITSAEWSSRTEFSRKTRGESTD